MLKRLFSIVRISCYVVFGVAFLVLFAGLVLSNQKLVTVSFWEWVSAPIYLSQALFISFFFGATVAVFLGLLMVMRLTIGNRRLRKKLSKREQELQKLRIGSLSGIVP